jgi:hypothetical protein
MQAGEDPTAFAVRVVDDLRAIAPISAAGKAKQAIAAPEAAEPAAPGEAEAGSAPPAS